MIYDSFVDFIFLILWSSVCWIVLHHSTARKDGLNCFQVSLLLLSGKQISGNIKPLDFYIFYIIYFIGDFPQ